MLKSAWQVSKVTKASLFRGGSRKEPQSRLQFSWRFRITSWETSTLAGGTGTLGGNWTIFTSRASPTRTTSASWRQAKRILSLVKECIDGFLAAGMGTGLDKTFWTSTTHSPNASLRLDGHAIPWTEKITFVGAKLRLCGNSDSSMTNRLQKATGVFEKWSSILCDKSLDLLKRIPLFQGVGVLQSCMAKWIMDFDEKNRRHILLPGVRGSTPRMLGLKRGPEEDIGSFWMRIHRMGHQCMKQSTTSPVSTFRVQKHRMAGHFARLEESHIVAKVLHCRDLSWWRQQQHDWEVNGKKWSGVRPARFACWRWEQDFRDLLRETYLW